MGGSGVWVETHDRFWLRVIPGLEGRGNSSAGLVYSRYHWHPIDPFGGLRQFKTWLHLLAIIPGMNCPDLKVGDKESD